MLPALHSLVAGFVRRTWLVTVVAVGVCANFAAHAVAALSGEVVAESLTPRAAAAKRPAPQPLPRTPLDGAILVLRNIFCSTCAPVIEPGPTGGYRGEPAVLIATSLGRETRATVHVLATDVQGDWMVGETIPRVGRVERIGPTSIDVSDDSGARTSLSLLEAPASKGAGAATPAPATVDDALSARVRQLGDNTYEVDRGLVRELVTGAAKPTGARVFPLVEKGEIKGVRMLGVRPGLVAAALGLKNGDVIAGINGEPIKSAQQLLDLYAQLDQLSLVEFTGTRAGKPLALTLRLR